MSVDPQNQASSSTGKEDVKTYLLLGDGLKDSRRLDVQHDTLKESLGGLFIPSANDAVESALKPRQDGKPAILDIGTGSGAWALDMAKRYPHADVLGLDIVPVKPSVTIPANCKFDIYDINEGVGSYANSFDVIHGRAIVAGIKGYCKLLRVISQMLRPGGVYLGVETPWLGYNEDKKPIRAMSEDEPGFSWGAQIPALAHDVMRIKNPGCFNAMEKLPGWLRGMDCWSEVKDEMRYFAVGEWEEGASEEQKRLGRLSRDNVAQSNGRFGAVIKAAGFPSELVDSWVEQANATDTNVHRYYTGWNYVWAVKK